MIYEMEDVRKLFEDLKKVTRPSWCKGCGSKRFAFELLYDGISTYCIRCQAGIYTIREGDLEELKPPESHEHVQEHIVSLSDPKVMEKAKESLEAKQAFMEAEAGDRDN